MITATVLMHPDKAPSMFINELGVREEYQRRGIATELTNRMLAVARNRNCEGVWLGTEEDNDGALAFYRAQGADEVRGSFFGWDDAL